MNTLQVYQVDSFTTEPLAGNPAGVVLGADGLPDRTLQAIARELNNSETAFVLEPDGHDHDVRVRFFTPTVEVPSCGHATIAAHYVRARVLGLSASTVIQKIGAGVLPVEIVKNGHDSGDMEIVMTQGEVEISEKLDPKTEQALCNALGFIEGDRNLRFPVRIASTGHSKVMVGINTRDALNRLRPRMARLVKLSREIGCNGYYVFTMDSADPDVLVHGRMFAPAIGIDEDPVTGNANGPLGAYLVDMGQAKGDLFEFTAMQGEACGRPGTVRVVVEAEGGKPRLVKVAGRAVVVFEAEMRL